jgi:cobalt-zinc-cadmium efflux system protein
MATHHHHDHQGHDHGTHSHGANGHDGHDHGSHGHGGHSHAPADFGRAFAIGITLNIAFVLVEGGYGLWANSLALVSDAGHNLSDVLGLAVAWAGASLAKRPANKRFTWGLRGSTILAALINALLLMVALGAIALGAVQRLFDPQPVQGLTMMIVATIGIVINMGTALLFAGGRKSDINIRGAYLHMAADAAVSAAVVVAGAVILWTGINLLDPLISLAIAALIFWQTWGLLRESVVMSLAAVPAAIDYDAVAALLAEQPGVERVHDLHIWPMSTTETALSAHLIMPAGHPGDAFLTVLADALHDRFGIEHSTVQIETGAADCGACIL